MCVALLRRRLAPAHPLIHPHHKTTHNQRDKKPKKTGFYDVDIDFKTGRIVGLF